MEAVPSLSGLETGATVLGRHVQMIYAHSAIVKEPCEAGKIRILVLGTDRKLDDYPGVPTFYEVGYPEVNCCSWYGVGVSIRVPERVSDKKMVCIRRFEP